MEDRPHRPDGRVLPGVSTALKLASAVAACLAVANCGSYDAAPRAKRDPRLGVKPSPRVVAEGQPVPKGGGVYMVGKPYQVADRWYVPKEVRRYQTTGLASWYDSAFHGRLTANGEVFDSESLSAAHPTLPIPSYIRVTNLENGRSVVVRVNDRGPYHGDRLLDVSKRTAEVLGFKHNGTTRVHVTYTGVAPLEGSDDRKLLATLRINGRPAGFAGETLVASAEPQTRPAPPRRPEPSVALAALRAPAQTPAPRPVEPPRPATQTARWPMAPAAADEPRPRVSAGPVQVARADLPPREHTIPAATAAAPPAPKPAPVQVASPAPLPGISAAPAVRSTPDPMPRAAPASQPGEPRLVWTEGPGALRPSVQEVPGSSLSLTGIVQKTSFPAGNRSGASSIAGIAAPAVAKQGRTRLFVEAGSYRDAASARRLGERLASLGGVDVAPVGVSGQTLYRVRVGPLRDSAAADEVLREAQAAGAAGARLSRL